ncbi:hypothetical protein FHS18_006275 [Paenibacillus phyllosphaerae]|uniref:C-deglycosylation enzyme beta subunit n=1 Tax=Paenibacillus phyllosphaerae TaxID=274593 RepID=A0A7W5B4C1_9BACL|nr:DUF6379 domain-containing protein [Paenibacillus phyllosphaerae]MBB3114157.1 hypothetical protein [Paenibacillus phyllosphaerae]
MSKGNIFGYDRYMICEDGFQNIIKDGETIGFQVRLRIANYRGYILSQIEDIQIAVDGEQINRADIRFTIGDLTYTLDEMEEAIDQRWELTQIATITCLKPGGLTAGSHEVYAEEHIRASYIPIMAVSHSQKTLELAV